MSGNARKGGSQTLQRSIAVTLCEKVRGLGVQSRCLVHLTNAVYTVARWTAEVGKKKVLLQPSDGERRGDVLI